jgi:hypothetical protein
MSILTILETGRISNMQMELLKVFKEDMPNEQIDEIKNILSNYFMGKAMEEFDMLEEKNGWTKETYEQWGNQHWRKAVKS